MQVMCSPRRPCCHCSPHWPPIATRMSPPQANRMVVLLLTFLCYTAYHASRKPPSIVKSVLHGDSSADENSEWWWHLMCADGCVLHE